MSQYFYTASGNLEIIDTPEETTQTSVRVYPWHIHLHHWTAGRVATGAVWLACDGVIRQYRTNGIFLIPPRVPHQLVVEPGAAMTVLSYSNPALLAHFTWLIFASKNSGIRFATDEGLRKLFLAASDMITTCQQSGNHPVDIMAKAVASIAAQIVAAPQMEFPLAAVAQHAGFSRWHFLRCFQTHTGMTPHALQTQCRLRLLRDGIRMNADLATLATSTGFTDQSHMHKLFKRHHHLTPKQFRQASFRLPW
ncbi:MAG: AraC family transcriptional regulator [Desulfobulbaceae bacterium]|jgi:AraC-like DNA-binding protein|nr:AraC family transcriptional regulator [Desulfobulbaceae bacterium]